MPHASMTEIKKVRSLREHLGVRGVNTSPEGQNEDISHADAVRVSRNNLYRHYVCHVEPAKANTRHAIHLVMRFFL